MAMNSRYLTIHIFNLLCKYDTLNQENQQIYLFMHPPSPPPPPQTQILVVFSIFSPSHFPIWFQLQSP